MTGALEKWFHYMEPKPAKPINSSEMEGKVVTEAKGEKKIQREMKPLKEKWNERMHEEAVD